MTEKQDIWMPLFIGDYLRDTTRLNTEQHGAYLLMIMDYWSNGAPPDDDEELANITRLSVSTWRKYKSKITKFFVLVNGQWHHKRIDEELNKAANNRSSKAASGKKGAVSKWGEGDRENKVKRSERLANARRLGTHSLGEWNALKHICDESCVRCGDTSELVKDHIKPIYQGGSDGIDNIQPLCRRCNSSKGPDSTDFRPKDWKERLAKCMANAWQTPNPSPSPSSTDVSNTQSNSNVSGITPAASACIAIKEVYDLYHKPATDISQSNPTLQALLDAGATDAEFRDSALSAMQHNPPKGFAWILGRVKGQRKEAANMVGIHQGAMPAINAKEAGVQAAAKSIFKPEHIKHLTGAQEIEVQDASKHITA